MTDTPAATTGCYEYDKAHVRQMALWSQSLRSNTPTPNRNILLGESWGANPAPVRRGDGPIVIIMIDMLYFCNILIVRFLLSQLAVTLRSLRLSDLVL